MSNGVKLKPVAVNFTLKDHIYDVLRDAILDMNIYDEATDLRLDERKLAEQLGISRTPIREALARLEQSGFVEIQPRRGVFVRRKSLDEVLEMIVVWAGAREHGGAAGRRARDRRRADARCAGWRRSFSQTDGAGRHLRILRAEHPVPPAHPRAVALHDAEDDRRRAVPAHARRAAPGDGRERPRHAARSSITWASSKRSRAATRQLAAERVCEHTMRLHDHVRRTWTRLETQSRSRAEPADPRLNRTCDAAAGTIRRRRERAWRCPAPPRAWTQPRSSRGAAGR